MFTPEELREIYRRLAAPFAEEAIERTKGVTTGRGYNTTGVKVQYIINRLNEVVGLGGYGVTREFTVRELSTQNGRPLFETVCDLTLQLGQWVDGQFIPFAESNASGGHVSTSLADSRKGAHSNALKKASAALGCGWQAYAGVIDDDNVPAEGPLHAEPDRGNDQPVNERRPGNGRVTSAQLAKLRELVDQRGREWGGFCEQVRQDQKVAPEYLSRKVASDLISKMIDEGRGGNGRRA